MYALPNSRIQIYDFVNTGIRFCQYQYTISLIPVYDFVNTGNIFKDLGRFEVEIEDSKNMGGLRIMSRYGIEHKKKSIFLFPCPFKEHCASSFIFLAVFLGPIALF